MLSLYSVRNFTVVLSCLVVSSLSFAAGVNQAPSSSDSWYVGLGASTLSVRTAIKISTAVLDANNDADVNNPYFSPVVQLGWMHQFPSNLIFGVRAEYTALNLRSIANGTAYKLEQNNFANLLFQEGVRVGQKDKILFGVGPSLLHTTFGLGNTSYNNNVSQWNVGITGQLDYMHAITKALSVDVAYAYSYTNVNARLTTTAADQQGVGSGKVKGTTVNQAMVTLNYMF